MRTKPPCVGRRKFLKSAACASAALVLPQVVSGAALGKNGAAPPSEKIVLGGIGIGGRGSGVLSHFLKEPDVQFVAVADVQARRRAAVKQMADSAYKNNACMTYHDLRELLARGDIDAVLIGTGSNWHATASILAARAGKDVYCEKPCTKTIAESLALAEVMRRTGRVYQAGTQRSSGPNFRFAVELARSGKLGKLLAVHAEPHGMNTKMSGWPAPEPEPDKEQLDWDMYLGPAAWRPFSRTLLSGFNFEKGGGMVGGGVMEWGSHCVDLCQWAADTRDTAPVEYNPPVNKRIVDTYATGVKLVLRDEGWLGLGYCGVRFEGEAGWVETGDSGELVASSPALLAGWRRPEKVKGRSGDPTLLHVRNFLDCVKTRALPHAHADATCWAHVACHATNIATFLRRQLKFEPRKCEFIGDEEANRLRGEAHRAPWRL